jgi:hypothetical protein
MGPLLITRMPIVGGLPSPLPDIDRRPLTTTAPPPVALRAQITSRTRDHDRLPREERWAALSDLLRRPPTGTLDLEVFAATPGTRRAVDDRILAQLSSLEIAEMVTFRGEQVVRIVVFTTGDRAAFREEQKETETVVYRLSRRCRLGFVPPTMPHLLDGIPGSLQLWARGRIGPKEVTRLDERHAQELARFGSVSAAHSPWFCDRLPEVTRANARVFGLWVGSMDTHENNWVIGEDARGEAQLLWYDHFGAVNEAELNPRELATIESIGRDFYQQLKSITAQELRQLASPMLRVRRPQSLDRLEKNRQQIVARIDQLIAERGEDRVLLGTAEALGPPEEDPPPGALDLSGESLGRLALQHQPGWEKMSTATQEAAALALDRALAQYDYNWIRPLFRDLIAYDDFARLGEHDQQLLLRRMGTVDLFAVNGALRFLIGEAPAASLRPHYALAEAVRDHEVLPLCVSPNGAWKRRAADRGEPDPPFSAMSNAGGTLVEVRIDGRTIRAVLNGKGRYSAYNFDLAAWVARDVALLPRCLRALVRDVDVRFSAEDRVEEDHWKLLTGEPSHGIVRLCLIDRDWNSQLTDALAHGAAVLLAQQILLGDRLAAWESAMAQDPTIASQSAKRSTRHDFVETVLRYLSVRTPPVAEEAMRELLPERFRLLDAWLGPAL